MASCHYLKIITIVIINVIIPLLFFCFHTQVHLPCARLPATGIIICRVKSGQTANQLRQMARDDNMRHRLGLNSGATITTTTTLPHLTTICLY